MLALNQLGVRDLAQRIAAREITCEALMRACLERIEERESIVGAWAHYDPGQALAHARAHDNGPHRGTLHGIPIGVKDVIDTAELPTEYGSPIYRGHRPAWGAACDAMARVAGAIAPGKTVTAELATPKPGKTVNPHNPLHTPGGSSSGSAAAVADFMVPLAVGTQTGGSLIRPASFCGVVAYKPSFGLINRAGVKPVSDSLDTVGVMARSVEDAALFAAASSGRPELGGVTAAAQPRVGIWHGPEWHRAAPESIAAVENAASALAKAGSRVTSIGFPAAFADLAAAHRDIEHFELARALAFEYARRRELLSEGLRSMVELGLACPASVYHERLGAVARCGDLLREIFLDVDVLLTASAPGEAPAGIGSTGDPVFNRPWTMLHVPCVTLPAFRGPHGLPVGIQIVGPRNADAQLLAAASWIGGRRLTDG